MKKSTKTALIIALVLMLVGGIVALVCMVLGGDLDDLSFYIRGPYIHVEETDRAEQQALLLSDEEAETWTFDGQKIRSLDLDLEAGTLYLQNGDTYKVMVQNGRRGLRCEVKNGVLQLKETDSIHTLLDWSGNHTPTILVMIPESARLETVKVSVGAGNVQAQDLQTKSLDIDVDAGNFSCQQLEIQGRCQLDVDAGSVMIENGQIQGGLQVDVDAGMVSYAGSLEGDWKVDVDAGSVELTLAGVLEDYDYQIEYDLGNVYLDGREYSGMSDEISLDHDAPYRAQIQCDVGQVDVSFTH